MFPVKLIDELLQESANKDEAIKMESYMKNNFKFFGARAPVVKEIFKKLITVYTIHPHELKELVTHLWKKMKESIK